MVKNILVTLFAITFAACATPPKMDAIPSVDGNNLPSIHSQKLNPKAVMVEVMNSRSINKVALNTTAVAEAVKETLTAVVQKSDLAEGKTTNLWRVELLDCDEVKEFENVSKNKPSVEQMKQTPCVKVKSEFLFANFRYNSSAHASSYTGRANGDWTPDYDVNEAFRAALTIVINSINREIDAFDFTRSTKTPTKAEKKK